jgi:hypothetical protein
MSANQVLTGLLRQLKEAGLDKTTHKRAIPPGDMEKLYTSGTLSNNTPKSLQYKVYVELSLNFGRRGREGLRELTKDSIVFKTDDFGRQYATLNFNELDKNHQVQAPKESEKKQIMYEQIASKNCPVNSLKKYLRKLNPQCNALFQWPKPGPVTEEDSTWYENKTLGVHKLESMMKIISQEANLSNIYTNHCLRATTSTVLANAGIEARQICSVTGHKNEASLASYIREPSMKQRANMCDIIHQYGNSPATETITSASTVMSIPSTSILPHNNKTTNDAYLHTSKANISLDATSAVFAGANFSGDTTINVMIHHK